MKFASDQLLAGAALTDDEYRTRHRRDADDCLLELRERRTRPDERGLEPEAVSEQRDLGREAAALDRILDLLRDPLHRLGLVDETVSAKPDRLRAAVVIARSRIHDHRHTQSQALDRAQHFEAIHAGHLEIENDAIDRVARQALECRAAALGDERLVAAQALQVVRVLLSHRGNVINKENDGHGCCTGISTMNVDPFPGSVSTLREPLESSTSRRTIERPSPVPPGLVV